MFLHTFQKGKEEQEWGSGQRLSTVAGGYTTGGNDMAEREKTENTTEMAERSNLHSLHLILLCWGHEDPASKRQPSFKVWQQQLQPSPQSWEDEHKREAHRVFYWFLSTLAPLASLQTSKKRLSSLTVPGIKTKNKHECWTHTMM